MASASEHFLFHSWGADQRGQTQNSGNFGTSFRKSDVGLDPELIAPKTAFARDLVNICGKEGGRQRVSEKCCLYWQNSVVEA